MDFTFLRCSSLNCVCQPAYLKVYLEGKMYVEIFLSNLERRDEEKSTEEKIGVFGLSRNRFLIALKLS